MRGRCRSLWHDDELGLAMRARVGRGWGRKETGRERMKKQKKRRKRRRRESARESARELGVRWHVRGRSQSQSQKGRGGQEPVPDQGDCVHGGGGTIPRAGLSHFDGGRPKAQSAGRALVGAVRSQCWEVRPHSRSSTSLRTCRTVWRRTQGSGELLSRWGTRARRHMRCTLLQAS